MKILLINPNSSEIITQALKTEAGHFRGDNFEVDVMRIDDAPAIIGTTYEELQAGVSVLNILKEKEKDYDGAIIGCFADPGLKASREILRIPVAGLFESSAIMAKMKGPRYSIVSLGDSSGISPWIGSVRGIGDTENVASVRVFDYEPEAVISGEADEVLCEVIEACGQDGADAVILGCAAFAGKGRMLAEKMGIPVIDGVSEALFTVKLLWEYERAARNGK